MTPTLHIQLLGRFRLSTDDAPVTTLDSPRLQALLAYLVLQRAAPHARAHLAFQLWPDTSERQAHANLRTLLHRFRQALPEADRFLHIDAQAVQWRADAPATLDVADFERELALAAAAEQVGNQDAAKAALREAVEQYRGDLLPGWYDDWVLVERERLRQLFLTGLEKLVLLLEQANEYAAAIGYAQRLLRHDPLHEATYQHLMRLHALSGDRASAVRVYRTCATILERELGVEPSPATHEAYKRLRQMEAQPPPASRPMSLAAGARRHNLPIALTSFIGRVHELIEIRRLLATTRLLTLTGAGGCGKTRLALAAATTVLPEYPDGVWLVELAELTDRALVAQAVAAAFGVHEEPQRSLTITLVDALRPRTLLLLLDNCEHLLDSCAQLAKTLLSACPHLRILATSREALGVAGETSWLAPSLSLPPPQQLPPLLELTQSEAVELFVERAAATLPTFLLTPENAQDVVRVCQRLDGIPLAIELAAARVKVLPVAQIAARLDDSFRLLTGGGRTAVPRHQSLRATIDWSYDLLAEPERALFRRLAVFAGGWTLEAAEAICTDGEIAEDTVLELLAHLVDKSLVLVDLQPPGEARYWLLETVRQYGHERLREAGETVAIERHAAYYLALAEHAEPRLRGPEQRLWLDRLEQEHANLRAALAWSHLAAGSADIGLRLAGALWWFWWMRGHWSEGRAALKRALAQPEVAKPTVARAKALRGAGRFMSAQRELDRATAFLEESLAMSRSLGDVRGMALSLAILGRVMHSQNDYEPATSLLQQSLALFQDLGDTCGNADVLVVLGEVAADQCDNQRATALFEASLGLYQDLGDKGGCAECLERLGLLAYIQSDYLRTIKLAEESLALAQELGYKEGIGRALERLACVAREQGDATRATMLFEKSLEVYRELGLKGSNAKILNGLGEVAFNQGDYDRAKELFEQSLALWRERGYNIARGLVLRNLGRVAHAHGDLIHARALLEESLLQLEAKHHMDFLIWPLHELGYVVHLSGDERRALALLRRGLILQEQVGARWHIAQSLERFAGVAVAQGNAEWAVRLFGAAAALRDTIGTPLQPGERADYDRNLTAARIALDDATFAAEWATGRALTLEQAIAEALANGA